MHFFAFVFGSPVDKAKTQNAHAKVPPDCNKSRRSASCWELNFRDYVSGPDDSTHNHFICPLRLCLRSAFHFCHHQPDRGRSKIERQWCSRRRACGWFVCALFFRYRHAMCSQGCLFVCSLWKSRTKTSWVAGVFCSCAFVWPKVLHAKICCSCRATQCVANVAFVS